MKTKPLPSPKSWTKLIPKVTRGLVSTNCPCWLRNSQRKLVRCRLRNHHLKTFQRWRVDSEVLAAPVDLEKVNENWVDGDLEIVNETVPKVTSGFFCTPSPCWLRNCQWKLSHCRLQNRERNRFQRWRVDSEVLAAPIDSEKVNEKWVGGALEIINDTSSKGDKWILQRGHPLLT